MDSEKLFKKGDQARGEDGSLLLVNEKQEAFKVNETILTIWNICDGIEFQELVKNIATAVQQDAGSVKSSLEPLFTELEKNSLLEIKQ